MCSCQKLSNLITLGKYMESSKAKIFALGEWYSCRGLAVVANSGVWFWGFNMCNNSYFLLLSPWKKNCIELNVPKWSFLWLLMVSNGCEQSLSKCRSKWKCSCQMFGKLLSIESKTLGYLHHRVSDVNYAAITVLPEIMMNKKISFWAVL